MTFNDASGEDGVIFNQAGNSVTPSTGSYEFWMNPNSFSSNHDACFTTKNTVASGDTGTDGIYFRFSFLSATDHRVYLYSSNGSSSGGQGFMFWMGNFMTLNAWHHIVLTVGGSATDDINLYKNGASLVDIGGKKAPINLLKLGVSMVQIGEKDQGCKMINGVEKQYPKANQSVIQKAKYESQKFECKQNS